MAVRSCAASEKIFIIHSYPCLSMSYAGVGQGGLNDETRQKIWDTIEKGATRVRTWVSGK